MTFNMGVVWGVLKTIVYIRLLWVIVLEDYNRSDATVVQKQNEIRHRILDSIKHIIVSFVHRVQLYTNLLVENNNDVLWSVVGVYYTWLHCNIYKDIYKGYFHNAITEVNYCETIHKESVWLGWFIANQTNHPQYRPEAITVHC